LELNFLDNYEVLDRKKLEKNSGYSHRCGAVIGGLLYAKTKQPHEDIYVLLIQPGGRPKVVEDGEVPEYVLPEVIAYNSLITYGGIPQDHITNLYYGTLDNLRSWADSINRVAGEEDFALISLRMHHAEGLTSFGTWEEIDEVLDLIKKPKLGVIVDTCGAAAGIPILKDNRRVIMVETLENQPGDFLSDLTAYMFRGYDPCKFSYPLFERGKWYPIPIYSKSADISPPDNRLSLLELFEFGAYNITRYDKEVKALLPARIIRTPVIWDPENIAGKIMMGKPVIGKEFGPGYHGE
jgi:hypothetical protein